MEIVSFLIESGNEVNAQHKDRKGDNVALLSYSRPIKNFIYKKSTFSGKKGLFLTAVTLKIEIKLK
jgi:hypothetical protein